MKLTIPLGTKVDTTDNKNEVKIRVPNTVFWVLGFKKENKRWDAYLSDPESNRRELIKEDATTESFARFSNVILKTPFPFIGKRAPSFRIIIKFIKQNTTNI